MPRRILTYDTTLRDGSQGEGISFSVADKLGIAELLDQLGIDCIEGGWPGSNPKDMEFFLAASSLKLRHARIAAFGSTRHAKNTPAKDPNLKQLVACNAPVVTIFGKSWDLHVHDALRVPLTTNLEMVSSSLAYLKKKVETVFFDAEHFFDGYRSNPEYAMQVLDAAVAGGAEALILCDTNGGSLPSFVEEVTAKVHAAFSGVQIGVHPHNDSGLAVANALAAVQAGATQVQGTFNGFGERTGNADLAQVIPSLELKMNCRTIGKAKLKHLTETSRMIYEFANLPPRNNQPFVGTSAFAHKGGIHVSAVARNKATYEHIAPETVGNERRILVSELSGRSNIAARVRSEISSDPSLMKRVLAELMTLENDGYAFEAADASFDLLVENVAGAFEPCFSLESYRVMMESAPERPRLSEATVKVRVGDRLYHTVDEGDHGPVDALYAALKKALRGEFPEMEDLHLDDYRVHIVNAQAGTAARVRVVVQSQYKQRLWGTVGVSANIIEASCLALVDSVNYLLFKYGSRKTRAGRGRKRAQ